MKIHPIQTGTVRCKQFQLTGGSNNLSRMWQILFTQKWGEWMPIYCWLIEMNDELILVDTGETADIYEDGYLPKGGLYHKVVQTRIKKEEEIDSQLKKLGFQPKDIGKVILTHMHGDHIGGLKHFSHADIFVSKEEYEMATSKKGPGNGYFPTNWPEWFNPIIINYTNNAEGSFSSSFRLNDNDSIVIIPTPGHSIGHQSVLAKSNSLTYFIGGDLTYNMDTLKKEIPDVVLLNKDSKETVKLAHEYWKSTNCVYLSSHDWNVNQILSDRITNKK